MAVAVFLVPVHAITHGGVAPVAAVVGGSGHTLLVVDQGDISTGRMVDHRIGGDADTDRVALLNHRLEFGFGSEFGIDPITDRLVCSPPLGALDGLLRRGDLDVPHTFRPVGFCAFLGNGVPRLLKRDNGDIALRSGFRRRRCVSCGNGRLSHQTDRSQRSARCHSDRSPRHCMPPAHPQAPERRHITMSRCLSVGVHACLLEVCA